MDSSDTILQTEFIRNKDPFIHTIKERCRVCYTCVRECPVKAIRITSGQAEVLPGHCIGCGNCVKVCRQNAKQYLSSIFKVYNLIANNENVIALVAPSFAAEFYEIDYMVFIGMLRKLGFHHVHEVGFGADLVARKTIELVNEVEDKPYIEASCPAVTEYVMCYHPEMVSHLAPVVSPMIATARVVRKLYGKNIKTVFIGPCIAKKFEAMSPEVNGEIDEVLTFKELREMFTERMIYPGSIINSDFDPPYAGKGALFPLSRGMHQAVNQTEDLMVGDIVTADGREGFIDAIKALESGELDVSLLELLCCKGCIMGPGMSVDDSQFKRRSRISRYVRQIMNKRDRIKCDEELREFDGLDLSRIYVAKDQRTPDPDINNIKEILIRMGKIHLQDELNCGACGYETCKEHAIAIYKGLAEDEMCLPYTIEKLHKTVNALGISNLQLASTKEALMQSEKLASMGQLSAGIAHELNNPLGVVLMYANIILDEIDENSNLRDDLSIIANEANRCKKIVSGLLNFARENKVILNATDINEMIDQTIKITDAPENIKLLVDYDLSDPIAYIDRDQIIQVINNLTNNAITAMPDGGEIKIKTYGDSNFINIDVGDTGIGIPEQNLKKIFEPFFTTKQIGKGTGLGLAVTYGIVKMHRGNIRVESNADPKKGKTGTKFIITLPRQIEEIIA